jgi:hypothetical protein
MIITTWKYVLHFQNAWHACSRQFTKLKELTKCMVLAELQLLVGFQFWISALFRYSLMIFWQFHHGNGHHWGKWTSNGGKILSTGRPCCPNSVNGKWKEGIVLIKVLYFFRFSWDKLVEPNTYFSALKSIIIYLILSKLIFLFALCLTVIWVTEHLE